MNGCVVVSSKEDDSIIIAIARNCVEDMFVVPNASREIPLTRITNWLNGEIEKGMTSREEAETIIKSITDYVSSLGASNVQD